MVRFGEGKRLLWSAVVEGGRVVESEPVKGVGWRVRRRQEDPPFPSKPMSTIIAQSVERQVRTLGRRRGSRDPPPTERGNALKEDAQRGGRRPRFGGHRKCLLWFPRKVQVAPLTGEGSLRRKVRLP